jgi:hypothetical protein
MILVTGPTQTITLGDVLSGDTVTTDQYEQADADIPHGDVDYTCQGIELPDGRVAVVMVLDDRGAGVEADTGNVNGSTVAGRVRDAYNAAKGL